MADFNIRLLNRDEIDTRKWNRIINESEGGLLYALTDYLDGVCSSWKALILGDYEIIMPLPVKKKWCIEYLYQPLGLSQGGLFSKAPVSKEIELQFLNKIFKEFRYGTISLNENFSLTAVEQGALIEHDNYVLSLKDNYSIIYDNYNADGKKNLRRAAKFQQTLSRNASVQEIVELYLKQYGDRGNNSRMKKEFSQFSKLLNYLVDQGNALLFCVRETDTNQLLSGAIIGFFKNRLYYLLGAPSPKGLEYKSTHFLIDGIVQQYAGTDFIFDFEGSKIPSVATFYKKFGPKNYPFKEFHFNRLPYPMKLLKK